MIVRSTFARFSVQIRSCFLLDWFVELLHISIYHNLKRKWFTDFELFFFFMSLILCCKIITIYALMLTSLIRKWFKCLANCSTTDPLIHSFDELRNGLDLKHCICVRMRKAGRKNRCMLAYVKWTCYLGLIMHLIF